MGSGQIDPLFAEYFLPFFVTLWVGVSLLISGIAGWRELAKVYRAAMPFTGRRWWFQSAEMRWRTSYGGCMNIGANKDGLYLSVLFLFRLGHPPLFIPWPDISAIERRSWLLFKMVELRCRKVPTVPIRIYRRLAEKISEAAGADWPPTASLTAAGDAQKTTELTR